MVVRSIQHWNKITHECNFTSLASAVMLTKLVVQFDSIGIENSVHWTLDVTFHEDECRIRSVHSPQNFANTTSHCTALERETSFRRSIRQKSRRAAMNDQYMVSVLWRLSQTPALYYAPPVNRV